MRADQHMHTCFSSDSDSTPEEMAEGALAKGLSVICFTDHYDKDDFDWGPEDIFDPEDYFPRMRQVKEAYRDQLDIRIGIELGLQPHLGEFYHQLVGAYPFDFCIGSVHSVARSDVATRKIFFDRSDEDVYHQILSEMAEDVRISADDFDVLGHLDYMVRYGTYTDQTYTYDRFAQEIDAILRLLVEKGKGLEVNTSGLRYGLPFMHPQPAVLKRFRELGGEIVTVGADAHEPGQIAADFDAAADLLRDCGFTYYAEFKNREPKFFRVP